MIILNIVILRFQNRRLSPKGHYEKIKKRVTKYLYVNGEKPSGLASAFVVSEKEAKGTDINLI